MDEVKRMRNDLFVEPKRDGRIEYGIRKGGTTKARASSLASSAAVMAGNLLIAARQAHELSGAPYPETTEEVVMAILEPSTYGIREFPTLEPRVVIEFGFATASLGMSLSLDAAKSLGQQLIAMSASAPKAGGH